MNFKIYKVMSNKTKATFCGFGHRVNLVYRQEQARQWAVIDNRRIVHAGRYVENAKDIFSRYTEAIINDYLIER